MKRRGQKLKGRFWSRGGLRDLPPPQRFRGSRQYPLLDSTGSCYDGSPCAVSFMLPACHVIVSVVDHKAVDNVCCTNSSSAVSTVGHIDSVNNVC